MKLVVGLGNPGSEYEWTRHNVGFEVLNLLARRHRLLFQSGRKLDGFQGPAPFEYAVHPSGALLIKPLTYMNRSGQAVAALARQLAVPPADILVVYDDFDLPLGALRLRAQGGAGTHNGMRSILDSLSSEQFPRLRVGIGKGVGSSGTDAARHVLERFRPDEQVEIEISAAHAADALDAWLGGEDLPRLMTRFHSRQDPGSGRN
ncbi:MAG: hypothetical protein RL277_2450 [Planctomycetota bacterium]|jgi:PTH1 family peptidyl-tRNA hydrolase